MRGMSEAKPFGTTCPRCSAAKVEGERYCRNCGLDLFAIEPEAKSPQRTSPPPPRPRKSIGLTVILAILFPGLGHLYAGRWARGLAIMLGFVLVLLGISGLIALLGVSVVGLLCVPVVIAVGILLFIPFELWQITDAMASSAAVNASGT